MANQKRKSDCPINYALEIFGDRWTLLIVRDLMFKGKHYYGEFQRSEEMMATNILADRLALLENADMVIKTTDLLHRSKQVYRLGQKGIDLVPILVDIIIWSSKYDKHSGADQKFVRSVKRDRAAVIQEISDRLAAELVV